MDAKRSTSSSARCAKGPLIYKKAEQELICKPCRLAYQIKDDIPVMLERKPASYPRRKKFSRWARE